ncbi:MAG: peptidoglycan-binding protein [Bacteroidetes bacterium]|nr:peptidoglycan-binding protein [Bacteroidota bacterium]
MESFKAYFLIFIFIVITGAFGYWAFIGLKTSTSSFVSGVNSEDVGPIVTSTPEQAVLNPAPVNEANSSEEKEITPPKENEEKINDEDENIIEGLEKLIADKVLMKKGSQGTRVGTVQEFLIVYGINISIDNDYGDSTVNAVKKFQSEQKLSADGQAGAGTFQKMIDWLKEN